MLRYSGMLYAKFGRKYIPTGKTGEDWDAMEKQAKAVCPLLPHIGSGVKFRWDEQERIGVVTNRLENGLIEVICDRQHGNEILTLAPESVEILG